MYASDMPQELRQFVDRTRNRLRTEKSEKALTEAVAEDLAVLLTTGFELPDRFLRPRREKYVMYPLYVAGDDTLSVASAVWDVGQRTPVHGHETWGVVGIYAGSEHERRYEKPSGDGVVPEPLSDEVWEPGQVTVCCTTDNDVHEVWSDGDSPCVGIHVYGRDMGRLSRRSYDPKTGMQSWFVSNWPKKFEMENSNVQQ